MSKSRKSFVAMASIRTYGSINKPNGCLLPNDGRRTLGHKIESTVEFPELKLAAITAVIGGNELPLVTATRFIGEQGSEFDMINKLPAAWDKLRSLLMRRLTPTDVINLDEIDIACDLIKSQGERLESTIETAMQVAADVAVVASSLSSPATAMCDNMSLAKKIHEIHDNYLEFANLAYILGSWIVGQSAAILANPLMERRTCSIFLPTMCLAEGKEIL